MDRNSVEMVDVWMSVLSKGILYEENIVCLNYFLKVLNGGGVTTEIRGLFHCILISSSNSYFLSLD